MVSPHPYGLQRGPISGGLAEGAFLISFLEEVEFPVVCRLRRGSSLGVSPQRKGRHGIIFYGFVFSGGRPLFGQKKPSQSGWGHDRGRVSSPECQSPQL